MESECCGAQPQPWAKTQWSRPGRPWGGGGDWAMAGVTLGSWTGHRSPPGPSFYLAQRCEVAPCQVAERCQNPQSPGKVWAGGRWESGPICGGVDSDPSKALIEAPAAGKCGRDDSHLDGVAKLLTDPPPALRPATAGRVDRNALPLWMAVPRAAHPAVPRVPHRPT